MIQTPFVLFLSQPYPLVDPFRNKSRVLGASTTFETALAADDLKPHAGRLFYFHFMAAGKTLRVKLRYRSRINPTSDIGPNLPGDIKELAMASVSEEIDEPVMEPMLEPLQTSFGHGNPSLISPPTMMPLTSAAILSQRRRRKNSASLKRSASTPNVRGMASGEAGMTLAEKRRNKLGYHRTSVACGSYSRPMPECGAC